MATELQSLKQAVQDAVQSAQEAKQTAQSIGQAVQEMKQSLQSAGMLSKDQQGGKATLGIEDITHDTGLDEAYGASAYSNTRLWNWNEKALAQVELSEKELALRQKEHQFSVTQKLDALMISEREQGLNFRHALNMDYAKFNNAVSEPISPNTQDAGNIPDAKGRR